MPLTKTEMEGDGIKRLPELVMKVILILYSGYHWWNMGEARITPPIISESLSSIKSDRLAVRMMANYYRHESIGEILCNAHHAFLHHDERPENIPDMMRPDRDMYYDFSKEMRHEHTNESWLVIINYHQFCVMMGILRARIHGYEMSIFMMHYVK